MEYNQDAVRLVKPYVDAKMNEAVATANKKLATYIVTSDEDPEKGTEGQLAVVDGTLKVCTEADDPTTTPATLATWKAVSHAS